jgi:hypothetical protein
MIGCARGPAAAVQQCQRAGLARLVGRAPADFERHRWRLGADNRVAGRVSSLMFSASPNPLPYV